MATYNSRAMIIQLTPQQEVGVMARVVVDMIHDADINLGSLSRQELTGVITFYTNLLFGGILCMNTPAALSKITTLYTNVVKDLCEAPASIKTRYYDADIKASRIIDFAGGVTRDTCTNQTTTPYCKCDGNCVNTLFNLFDTGAAKYTGCDFKYADAPAVGVWAISPALARAPIENLKFSRTHALVTACMLCHAGAYEVRAFGSPDIILLRLVLTCGAEGVRFGHAAPIVTRKSMGPNQITAGQELRCSSTEREIVRDIYGIFEELRKDAAAAETLARMSPDSRGYDGASNVLLWPNAKKATEVDKFLAKMSYAWTEHMFKFWGDFGQIMGARETGAGVGTSDKSMISIALNLGVPVVVTPGKAYAPIETQ
jgi:hypothetical protein